MEQEFYQRINPSAKKLWRINGIITSAFIMGISYVVYIFTDLRAFIPGVLLSIYFIFAAPSLEYRQWQYKITDRYVDYTHGIFFTNRTVIPISRIQHMDLKQGPLQKSFSLASVVIFTAGQAHEIRAILYSEAQYIVDSINQMIAKDDMNGKG